MKNEKSRTKKAGWRDGSIRWCIGFFILLSALCLPAWGQYSISWSTIDGGGGTIGQPDAGTTMTNGQYSVTGGFWALPQAVQTVGAPTLLIAEAGAGQATISWTPASTNWVLQETFSLTSAVWTNSPSGATNPIVVPATLSKKFYRLFKP